MVGELQWVLGWSAAGVNCLKSSSSFVAGRKGKLSMGVVESRNLRIKCC